MFQSQNGRQFLYSGGFDSFVAVVDLTSQKLVATHSVAAMISKFPDILLKPMVTPFVYSITHEADLGLHLVSLETGNVIGFYDPELKKPAFCIEGHGTKVIRRSGKQQVSRGQQNAGGDRF